MDENTRAIGRGPGGVEIAQPALESLSSWIQPGSPRAIQHHLGRKLQVMYAALPTTPVPDQFAQLLTQLDGAGVAD
ncbi:hypothetical protein MKK69_22785 [Methylobacterium sp. J-026]|uniref:NepR family anti-sigma factor n=1 Tax=Methylobacterium sp. J-026 TaxID=2836624 RepID=UPI001FB9DDED|nr:NepR family anti-sigma factor [Methylobacterium sp. J-026]MCJ2136842.1 hypothetical protein [Methylobacterium sp. J-026]